MKRIKATARENALREAADAIINDTALRRGHNTSVVCSCMRCEVAKGAARVVLGLLDHQESE